MTRGAHVSSICETIICACKVALRFSEKNKQRRKRLLYIAQPASCQSHVHLCPPFQQGGNKKEEAPREAVDMQYRASCS